MFSFGGFGVGIRPNSDDFGGFVGWLFVLLFVCITCLFLIVTWFVWCVWRVVLFEFFCLGFVLVFAGIFVLLDWYVLLCWLGVCY